MVRGKEWEGYLFAPTVKADGSQSDLRVTACRSCVVFLLRHVQSNNNLQTSATCVGTNANHLFTVLVLVHLTHCLICGWYFTLIFFLSFSLSLSLSLSLLAHFASLIVSPKGPIASDQVSLVIVQGWMVIKSDIDIRLTWVSFMLHHMLCLSGSVTQIHSLVQIVCVTDGWFSGNPLMSSHV